MGNRLLKLKSSEMAELQVATDFNKEQIRVWHRRFLAEFPDEISPEQFQDILRQSFHGNSESFSKKLFEFFDRNGDGKISFHEFLETLSIAQHGSIDAKCDWIFGFYDGDRDGYLTTFELDDALTSILELSNFSGSQLENVRNNRLQSIMPKNQTFMNPQQFRQFAKEDAWISRQLDRDIV